VLDLAALVERWAARRPHQVAVVTAAKSLTYEELMGRARDERTAGCVLPRSRRGLVASDAAEVAVALVVSVMADGGLLMLDPTAPAPEVQREQARFGCGTSSDLPAGLGLTTSGVTGEPRCVVRPWELVADNAAAFAEALGLTPDDVVMTTSSMHHSYAVSAGLCGALTAGASFVAPGGMLPPKTLARHIDRQRVSVLLSVPMLYRWYAAGLPVTREPRLCVSAGAPLEDDIRKAWEHAVGWPLVEHYGTSEMGQLTLAAPGDAGNVGRPLRGVRIRAAGETAAGERELEVSVDGPPPVQLEIADGAVTACPLTGWCATGDVGEVDAGGRVHLHGRRGGIVNVGGKKVALREVEAALRSLPGVRDCAVIADASAGVLPKLCALVEADPDFSGPRAVAHLREHLAPHKVPRDVLRVEELPRTGSGKIRRHELARLVEAHRSARPGPDLAVLVPFAGTGSGTSPLTWGGQSIRRSIEWLGDDAHYFNDPHVIALPEGISVEQVTAGLGALVSRHQALRTYYRSVDGHPVMQVKGRGTVEVSVQSPPGDARGWAEELAAQWGRRVFTAQELPLRCAVVQSGGAPRFLVLVLSHQSIDGWAVDLLLSELQLLWTGRAAELTPHPWQLLDQVADEETGSSQARGGAALRYWRKFYTAADPSLFDAPRRTPEPPAVRSVKMVSPSTQAATELAAARLRVSTSAVLAGLVAVILGQLTAHDRVTLLLIAGNRLDDRRRQLVAPMAQDVLCRVDLRDDVDEAMRGAARAALGAYSNACYDPAAERQIRRDAELRRGLHFDFHGAIFNDVRIRGKWAAVPGTVGNADAAAGTEAAVTAADLAQMRVLTTYAPGGCWDRQNTTFFVRIIRSPDTCRIELMADTHYVGLTDMRKVLTAIESLAVAAATQTVPLAEVPAVCDVPRLHRGAGWLRHANGWVDIAALKELVRGLPLCRAATVAVEAGSGPGSSPLLTAYIHPEGEPSAEDLHRAVVDAMPARNVVVAPDRYVLCASAPDDVDSPAAWESCGHAAPADGRPHETGMRA
jgi:acyl-coenzyme A synthetase/AMP-(fatty) acid ligase